MKALDYITVRGFKSIRDLTELRIRPINILIGANGSGKSNFIEVFKFLHSIKEGQLSNYVARSGGAERILHFGSKTTQELSIHLSFEDQKNQYKLKLGVTELDELVPVHEVLYSWDKSRYPTPFEERIKHSTEAGISTNRDSRIGNYVKDHLDKWRLYHFHDTSSSSPMKKASNINDNRYLRPDGSNLAAFLFYLKTRCHNEYEMIRDSIRMVMPFFDDFSLEPQRLNEETIRLEWKHRGSDEYFDSSAFSDGTLRFIALATLFLQPASLGPSVILVDEPELGLHPSAIELLAAMIKQASFDKQIIVSTQSSLVLDQFEPEDVLVTERIDQASRIRRLDPDDLDEWLKDYSLGQLWEKNEFGGRPGSVHV